MMMVTAVFDNDYGDDDAAVVVIMAFVMTVKVVSVKQRAFKNDSTLQAVIFASKQRPRHDTYGLDIARGMSIFSRALLSHRPDFSPSLHIPTSSIFLVQTSERFQCLVASIPKLNPQLQPLNQ